MNATDWASLVSLLIPALVAVLKKSTYPATYNAIIAIAVYAVAGLGNVVVSGQTFDLQNIVPSITLFVTGGTAAYVLFWKNVDAAITARIRG